LNEDEGLANLGNLARHAIISLDFSVGGCLLLVVLGSRQLFARRDTSDLLQGK
jgi:hypothetical protein